MILPSVTVVIPTRNRHAPLLLCLERLSPWFTDNRDGSVIVSDDGDAVETAAILANQFPKVRIVQGPRNGPAANRNCGATSGDGDLIVFLDDDCIPDSGLIATYQRAAAENPEISVFEGRISAQGRSTSFADVVPANETGGHLWSCNFAVRRRLFEQIHGFDERYPFPAMEDVELAVRLAQHSEFLFVPDARVWHRFERRAGWNFVQHQHISLILYYHLHGRDSERTPWFFLKHALRLLQRAVFRLARAPGTRGLRQAFYQIWVNVLLAFFALFWRWHARLAVFVFPACCSGCESVHRSLAIQPEPWTAVDRES